MPLWAEFVDFVYARYKSDPSRVVEETTTLYRENGITLVDGGSVFGAVVQAPVVLGLFGAIRRGVATGGRFLWVADLARPDAGLACLCTIVTAGSAALGPTLSQAQRVPSVVVPAILTLLFLSRMAAGVSLYTLASGVVGLGQAMLVRRRAARLMAA